MIQVETLSCQRKKSNKTQLYCLLSFAFGLGIGLGVAIAFWTLSIRGLL